MIVGLDYSLDQSQLTLPLFAFIVGKNIGGTIPTEVGLLSNLQKLWLRKYR
jgi:hypothetical protein